jgi:hypothetical protein
MTDNTTMQGWLKKSNFKENDKESIEMTAAKLKISRGHHALQMLKSKCRDYIQWFPGDENDLAGSLSRDFHLSNDQLLSIYLSSIPKQTPTNLMISLLPQEILSFLSSMLQTLPEQMQPPERHKTSSLAHGLV